MRVSSPFFVAKKKQLFNISVIYHITLATMKKILPLLAILLLAGCGTQQAITPEEPKEIVLHVGDDGASFSHEGITIIPVGSFTMEELKSNNQFQEDAVAGPYSKYLIVGYGLLNDTKEPVTFSQSDMPFIFDYEGRKFNPSIELTSDFYVPDAVQFLEVIPGIPTNGTVVYEVPKDATGFNVQAGNLKVMVDEDKE